MLEDFSRDSVVMDNSKLNVNNWGRLLLSQALDIYCASLGLPDNLSRTIKGFSTHDAEDVIWLSDHPLMLYRDGPHVVVLAEEFSNLLEKLEPIQWSKMMNEANKGDLEARIDALTTPVDFDTLIRSGVLEKHDAWYKVVDWNDLPSAARGRIRKIKQSDDGLFVTFAT